MRVRELCGPGRDLDVRGLPELMARFPWVRDARPATLEEGLRHLARTAPALLVDLPEPVEKAEQPPRPSDPPTRSHSPWDAARWVAGSPDPPAPHVLRAALVQADGDEVAGALRAYGLEPTPDLRAAVAAWLRAAPDLPDEVVEVELNPPDLAGDPAAVDLLRRAWAAARVWRRPDGSARLQDPTTGARWDFVPDREGQSAAAGCAYVAVARAWGVLSVLDCLVVRVGDRPGALVPVPDRELWSLDHLAARSAGLPRAALLPALRLGELHRWAVLDFVCGDPDRVGSTVWATWDGSSTRLLPARAAFGTQPFEGAGTFVPAYARCWAPAPWPDLSPEERWSRWPAAPGGGELGRWVAGLTPDPLLAACAARGVPAGPAVGRLARLQAACEVEGADVAVRRAWLEWAQVDP